MLFSVTSFLYLLNSLAIVQLHERQNEWAYSNLVCKQHAHALSEEKQERAHETILKKRYQADPPPPQKKKQQQKNNKQTNKKYNGKPVPKIGCSVSQTQS